LKTLWHFNESRESSVEAVCYREFEYDLTERGC
jgi:hypothetical protein